ncbi:PstS family phosphate ABC transporter substrate-binding protein [Haloarchaeobius sp. DT45]|uniref:PstS family phosphate ABC transporter substrate-binding protein n=1 Tax=Haloarchaeobius sp. DT45 TaxID=3446116 RepID=UPI003F6A8E23
MSRHDPRGSRRSNRRSVLRAFGAAAAGTLTGCVGRSGRATQTPTTTAGLSGTIRVAGSSTVYPMTLAVADRFGARHESVSVSVSSTGTGGGFADFFCDGRTHINDASRRIKDTELELCTENGVDPVRFPVASDALTVVVNPEADWVDCVTVDELAQIWGPDGADDWNEVREGWPAEPFELYGPTPASGTFDYFTEAIMGEEDAHRTDYEGTEQDATIVSNVQGSPYAMGYFGMAYYHRNQGDIRALSVDDGSGCIVPSSESVEAETYTPLSRPLFVYVDRTALTDDAVREFCRFYLRVSRDVATEVGYVPVSPDVATANQQRLERIIEEGR